MDTHYASRSGFVLVRTPSYRQQQRRRRLIAISAVVGLALASGVLGAVTAPKPDTGPAGPHPFSYFPSE